MAHHCHLPGCRVSTPPRFLMCPAHWRMVPDVLALHVLTTVDTRDKHCNASWAPWWRAQAKAIHAVQLATGVTQEAADKRLKDELLQADELEKGQPEPAA